MRWKAKLTANKSSSPSNIGGLIFSLSTVIDQNRKNRAMNLNELRSYSKPILICDGGGTIMKAHTYLESWGYLS